MKGNLNNNPLPGRHIDARGIRYFALGATRKNRLNSTKKRHISARTTEKWRFWMVLLLFGILILCLLGAWHELKLIIL